jgi:hypothetical protein
LHVSPFVLTWNLYAEVPGLQGTDRGCEPAGGANFSVPRSVILIFLLGSRRRAHHQREDVDGGPPGGAGAEGPRAPTINVKTSTTGPREVPELEIRERSACGARPSGRAVNACRNLGTNIQRVVRTYFTLTRVRHFC